MKLKDIVELTAMLVNAYSVIDSGVFNSDTTEQTYQTIYNNNADLRLIVKCAQLVLDETACDYAPIYKTETLNTTNGKILFSSLTERICEPIAIHHLEMNVPFDIYPDRIETYTGTVDFTYAYIPAKKNFFDTIIASTRITDRAIAYGAAAEFYLNKGQTDFALMWDKRYKDALSLLFSQRRYKPMPHPRWF
ncbi:MAG: hypothetical protein RR054_03760 [Clostridia bacterium]